MKKFASLVLLFLIAFLLFPPIIFAQPPVCRFHGEVWIDGNLASDGTIVTAWVDMVEVATVTVDDSYYMMNIEIRNYSDYGKIYIVFTVGPNNIEITETHEWQAGANIRFDLHVQEEVSNPDKPNGLSSGETGQTLVFETGGASCNLGHNVEYNFYWGDETYSAWSTSTSSFHKWMIPGTYAVKVHARCENNPKLISDWSEELLVNISEPITPTEPDTPTEQPTPTKESDSDNHTLLIVAIIGVAGTVFAAIITGLFMVFTRRKIH